MKYTHRICLISKNPLPIPELFAAENILKRAARQDSPSLLLYSLTIS